MFKIGEFSQLGQVSVRMLRHYDKMGLLTPGKIDKFTGYRYYTLDQLPRLNRILALKDLGLSLKEIAELIENDLQAEQLHGMLLMKQAQIQQSIIEEQRRLQRVAARLRQIEAEGQASPYEVIVKTVAPRTVASLYEVVPHIDDMAVYRCRMFDDVHSWLQAYGVEPAGPEIFIYHMEAYREENMNSTVAVPILPEAADELADRLPEDIKIQHFPHNEPVASTVHIGPIYDIPHAVISLFEWIHTSGHTMLGPTFELHLSGQETTKTDFSNITFEFQIPVMLQ